MGMHAAFQQELTTQLHKSDNLKHHFCYLDYTQEAGLIHTPDILDILEVQAPSVTEHNS